MRKALALAVLLFALPALAAVETTTITGKVLLPSGAPVTAGSITATLSTSGTATDGTSTSVVSSRVSAAIGADGTVSIVLVPNDVITPSGTSYTVKFSATAPISSSWTETWVVVAATDPIALGMVTRVNTPPGIAAPLSLVQDEGVDLQRRTKLNMIGAGVTCVDTPGSGRTDCTIPGGQAGGTPGGSSQDVQVNASSAFGSAPGFTANTTTGAVAAKILNGTRLASGYATGGDGLAGSTAYTGWASAITAGAGRVELTGGPDGSLRYYDAPDAGITIPSNVEIVGDGNAVLTWGPTRSDANGAMFSVLASTTNVTIANLRFEAGVSVPDYGTTDSGGGAFIYLGTAGSATPATGITIRNNRFGVARYSDGGDGTGPNDPAGSQILINGSVAKVAITDNTIDAAPASIGATSGHATNQVTITDLTISRNKFYYTQTYSDFGYAIYLSMTAGNAVQTKYSRLMITENTMFNVNGGIAVSTIFDNAIISDNNIESDILDFCLDTTNVSVHTVKSSNLTVSGNSCSSDTTPHNGVACATTCNPMIKVNLVDGFAITGNTVYGKGDYHLYVAASAHGIVSGNHMDMDLTSPGASSYPSCYSQGNSSGVTVVGNMCVNASGIAFWVDNNTPQTANNLVSNSVEDTNATAALTAGFYISGTCTGCSIVGNTQHTLSAPTNGMLYSVPGGSYGNIGYVGATQTYAPTFTGLLTGDKFTASGGELIPEANTVIGANKSVYYGDGIDSEGATSGPNSPNGHIHFPDWTGTAGTWKDIYFPDASGTIVLDSSVPGGVLGGTWSSVTLDADSVGSSQLASGAVAAATDLAAGLCSDGQILKKASGVWTCGSDDTGGGGTITGSGSTNQITYWTGTSTVSGDSGITLDATANSITATTFVGALTGSASGSAASFTGSLSGDVSGGQSSTVVADDSHAHTSTTISGVDISDDTNLAVTANQGLTLTGDSLALMDCALNQIIKRNAGDTAWECAADAGGGGNSFETINAPSGFDPVAESSTDTLNLVATAPMTITGDSSTDTLTVAVVDASGTVSGVVNTSAQAFAGLKTFNDGIATADPGDGSRGVELIDNGTNCPNPAGGSTSICTKAGQSYVRDTGGPDRLIADTASSPSWTGTHTFTAGLFGRNATTVSGAVDATHDGPVDVGAIAEARAHAARYGDPNYYLKPAVFDQWQQIFLSRASQSTDAARNDTDVEVIGYCYNATCTGRTGYVCVNAVTPGTVPLELTGLTTGDTFIIGTSFDAVAVPASAVPHQIISAPVAGTGTPTGGNGCPNTTTRLDVRPYVDQAAEGLSSGGVLNANARVVPSWREKAHPSNAGAYLLGYQLGYANRDIWGLQGNNLVKNPGIEGTSIGLVDGWATSTGALPETAAGGSLAIVDWDKGSGSTAPTQSYDCSTGSSGYDCANLVGSSGTNLFSTTPIQVQPGETYIMSGIVSSRYDGDFYGLMDDRDGNGAWTIGSEMKYQPGVAYAESHTWLKPLWFSRAFTIPEGVHAVKVLHHAADGSNTEVADLITLRKQTSWLDSTTTANYLINDPGSRNIVIVGDSWTDMVNPYGAYIKNGLAAALQARFGRDVSSQIILQGHGGDDSTAMLAKFQSHLMIGTHCSATTTKTCAVDGDCGGAETCLVNTVPNRPLYAIISVGVNDAVDGTPSLATYMANLKEYARRCEANGVIPIFVSPPPLHVPSGGVGVWGANSAYDRSHQYREAQRNYFMGLDNGHIPTATPAAEYAAYCPTIASGATIAIPDCKFLTTSGTTTVNTINTCNATTRGRDLTVLCGADATPFGDATGNIQLGTAFTCTPNSTLSLSCDGSYWQEVGRTAPNPLFYDALSGGFRSRLATPTGLADANNDGSVDVLTITAPTGTQFDYGQDNSSAIVYSARYHYWILIKNNSTPVHGYILSENLSTEIAKFDFSDYGGANVDSEGVTLTDPFGTKFYVSTEQVDSGNEYLMEFNIADALLTNNKKCGGGTNDGTACSIDGECTGGGICIQVINPVKQWTMPNAWCTTANSNEALAFVPDIRYGPTYRTEIPRGYFLTICQDGSDYATFTLDTDALGNVVAPTAITTDIALPCTGATPAYSSAAGVGVDYDWDTGLLWWSVGTTVAVTDARNPTATATCLDTFTVASVTDAEGIGIGAGYMVLADDASDAAGVVRYALPKLVDTAGASISDAAYGAGWDGVTTTAPSKNAVYDQMVLLSTLVSPTFTGTPAAPTASVDTNTTQIATTAYVVGQGYAKLANPTLTGTPLAPTAAQSTNSTQIATTAFVKGQVRTECFTLYDRTALQTGDSLPSIWKAPAAVTVTEVWCETNDANGTVMNLQRDDGSPQNVLSSNKTCTSTAGTGTIDTNEDNFADGDRLDLVIVSFPGTASKRLNVCVEYTYD